MSVVSLHVVSDCADGIHEKGLHLPINTGRADGPLVNDNNTFTVNCFSALSTPENLFLHKYPSFPQEILTPEGSDRKADPTSWICDLSSTPPVVSVIESQACCSKLLSAPGAVVIPNVSRCRAIPHGIGVPQTIIPTVRLPYTLCEIIRQYIWEQVPC